jgi:REase_MTES_1575
VPEQSAGGSLTQRALTPRVERPAPGAPGARPVDDSSIPPAIDAWRRSLAGSGMPDTLLAEGPAATASWLDLTHAHPSGLAQLFAARPTRLSSLFREPDTHAGAWRQARTIRASALVLAAQRGVQGCCLAVGVASWRPRVSETADAVQAPIVLRGCSIRARGAGDDDFDLELEDAVLINPELVRELVETYGIEADGARLAGLVQGPKGFDPRPVYAWLEEHGRSLRGFRIERRLVLATFAAGSGAVLADLDAAVPAIATHGLLGRVAAAAGPRPGAADLRLDLTGPVGPGGLGPGAGGLGPGPGGLGPGGGPAGGAGSGVGTGSAAVPAQPGPEGGVDAPAPESRRLAVVGRLTPRGMRPVRPPSEPDPAEELLVLDLDPAQNEAVAAALRGEHVVIEGPPGSGATHTVAAAVAGLVAAGRRVLVLSPRRASTEALLTRLEAAGLGDLVLDLRDSVGGRPATRTATAVTTLRAGLEAATSGRLTALPRPGLATANDELVRTVRRARELLDGAVVALHEVRRPWGVSAYDAMVALTELNGRRDGPTSPVRLPDEVLTGLDPAARERVRVHLHSAAAAGAFTLTRVDTRWYDARVNTDDAARRALEAALVLRAGLARARAAMDAATTAAGLRPATEARAWLPALELLLGVRSVVDLMSPQLYQQPLDELADAVAPRELRAKEAPGRGERRRLRRQAQALVRPGVHVPDLHEVLLTAGRQRQAWRRLSADGQAPIVVAGLTEAQAAVGRMMSALAVLADVFAGTEVPDLRDVRLDDLEQRVLDLAGDAQGILGQPRRAMLRDGLAGAGLGDLVDDLHSRRVEPDRIDAEFDLVWWSSVRDSIVRADPRLARHDPDALRAASADLRRAETTRIAAGSALVRAAVVSRAAKVATVRSAQVRLLRQELAQEDRRPRVDELVRRCGDVLAAIAPIWMMSPDTVAACLPPARPGAPEVDVVVVDDAGHIGLPEVVAALARGAQLIVAGDRRRLAPPDDSMSVIEALAPFARVCRLDRDHRARDGRMLVPLAPRYPEGWQLTPGTGVLPPLHLEAVPDGIALPPPGEELPVSSDAEVMRVVDLVERHAVDRPEESLAVVTLSERHAERIEEAVRQQVAERPQLGRWLEDQWRGGHPEPFLIRSVQRVLGVERDAAIVSVGLARTPHGRILHRFGVLDGDKGAAALTTAVSRARARTTVVCCFTADDLIVDRLRTAGARLLRDVLLAAAGRGTAGAGRTSTTTDGLVFDLRDRLATAGLPVQTRVGDGAWPLDIAVADPRTPGRMLVAVDLDGPAFSSHACRERERNRPMRWERAGWVHCKISAMDLFGDPAREVDRIRGAWERALAAAVDGPPPAPVGPGSSLERAAGVGTGERAQPSRPGDLSGPAQLPPPGAVPDEASVGSPVVSSSPRTPGPEDDDDPVLPQRAPDDSDEGWGDAEPDRDDEIRRDRPPHWD